MTNARFSKLFLRTYTYLCQAELEAIEDRKNLYQSKLKTNILHLERKFTTATETFIVNQINALHSLEHSVFTTEFLDKLEAKATIYAPESTGFFTDKVLSKNHKNYFLKQLDRIKPQLIHSHYITDAVVFSPLTKNLSIPKICSCYGYDVSVIPVKFKFFYKSFYRKIFAEYDLFLAMTNEMKKDLLEMGCPENKIIVHYHGIDTKRFNLPRTYELKDEHFTLLTVASLYEVKGHLSVLKALKKIVASQPELKIRYNMIGDGPLKNSLEKYAQENGLSTVVHFCGAIKHGDAFNTHLMNADVFLHPSITTKDNDKEGIPGALVEAMASGLPTIATYHGGIPAVVAHKETGFLVKEHDFDAISKFILDLHQSKSLRAQIGTNAKNFASKNLDVYEKAKDLIHIYESV